MCCLPEGGCTELTVQLIGGVRSESGNQETTAQLLPASQPSVFTLSVCTGALRVPSAELRSSEVPLMASHSSRRKVISVPSLSLYSIPNAHWHLPPPFYRNCSLKSQKLFFRKVSACHMSVFHAHTVGLLCRTGFCRSLFSSKSHFQNLNSVIL